MRILFIVLLATMFFTTAFSQSADTVRSVPTKGNLQLVIDKAETKAALYDIQINIDYWEKKKTDKLVDLARIETQLILFDAIQDSTIRMRMPKQMDR